jgi:exonuclease SbcC
VRPLRLSLRNFLSYREPPPLDLRGVQVVCLSGDNGHGKSALLDAITWVLWGCARGRKRQDIDSLVHQGQREMEVEMEFALDGAIYRVRRLYQRPSPRRPTQHRLALQVADPPDRWRDISGDSLQETQGKINALLGMDYETFVHTAYLLQGEADRFSRATPQNRRLLLADILGLHVYQRACEAAKREADLRERDLARLGGEIAFLMQEVARRPRLEEEVERAQAHLAHLTPLLEDLRREVEALKQEEERLHTLQRQREALLAQAAERERQAEALRHRAQSLYPRIQEAQDLLARAEEIRKGRERYEEASRRLEAMEGAREEQERLARAIAEAEKAIAQEKARLEQELRHAQGRLEEARRRAEEAPSLEEALRRLEEQETALAARESALQTRQREVDALREEASAHEARARGLRREIEALRQRLEMLQAQPEPVCPLCNTPLGPEGKAHLEGEMADQATTLRREHDAAVAAAQQARQRAQGMAREVEARSREVEQERRALIAQKARTAQALEEARRAARQAGEWAERVREVGETLAREAFALREREALDQARRALQGLGYDPQAHQALRQAVKGAQPFVVQYELLERARQDLPRLEREWQALGRDAERCLQEARQAREEAERLQQAVRSLPALQQALREKEALLAERGREWDRLQQEIGGLRRALQEVEEKERRLQALRGEARALERDRDAYRLLEQAFRPQGIPTRIIESVIQDLSEMASEVLRRLTNGRMALRIETVRQQKGGGYADALDVHIDDGLGERPYELFSGGERFRVDFALRLALGRLLAQRRGRPIRTLFIDEGFGSQDAEGRMRLVEAIQAVRSDFDLIVVVTHLDDLKEQFPARIEVTKTPHGSWFETVLA